MFTFNTNKFTLNTYPHPTLARKVLGFLRWATRIGYAPQDYEYYYSMDNWVEVGCTICDMLIWGLPREEWKKLPKEAVYCDRCKEYRLRSV